MAWGTLAGHTLGYETEADSVNLQCRQHQLFRVQTPDFSSFNGEGERDLRWELISILAMWFVWRARCRQIFEGRSVPPTETLRDFWLELIHTLRGKLDRLKGDSDAMI